MARRLLIIFYLASRLLISLFSAALWSPATEATSSRGRMRAERREEFIFLVRIQNLFLRSSKLRPASASY